MTIILPGNPPYSERLRGMLAPLLPAGTSRSEERRVGKECL